MSLSSQTSEIAVRCLCRRVRALSRRVTGVYDEALRETGLTANQLTVLVAAQRAGEISPGRLGDRLGMEKSTVSRTVARMIDKGWLEAVSGPGRIRRLGVTAAGREQIVAAHPRWRRAQRAVRDALGAELAEVLLSREE